MEAIQKRISLLSSLPTVLSKLNFFHEDNLFQLFLHIHIRFLKWKRTFWSNFLLTVCNFIMLGWNYNFPTDPFPILEPKICQSAVLNYVKFVNRRIFEAMKLWKGRSDFAALFLNVAPINLVGFNCQIFATYVPCAFWRRLNSVIFFPGSRIQK